MFFALVVGRPRACGKNGYADLRNVARDLWDLLGLQNQYFLQVIVSFKLLQG